MSDIDSECNRKTGLVIFVEMSTSLYAGAPEGDKSEWAEFCIRADAKPLLEGTWTTIAKTAGQTS